MPKLAIWQWLRSRLPRRTPAPPGYPRVVEGVLKSGRRYRLVIKSDPRTWPAWDDEVEPAFTAPVTSATPDANPTIETTRPAIIPPMAVSLAAARQHLVEVAGLADDDDDGQERDRRLVWWFRRLRDQTATTENSFPPQR